MIISSTDTSARNLVGGKAASLMDLRQNGFAPPDFFVILPTAFSGASAQKSKAHPDLAKALTAALKDLGNGPFAVRSSGHGEDGIEHSHAGQYDSILNVPAKKVLAAAHSVWRSGFSQRLATYASLKGSSQAASSPPAIIVQTMIAAKVSGVAFSADPVSGLQNRTVISAIAGLGEKLVSGEEDGQTWVLSEGHLLNQPEAPPLLNPENLEKITRLTARAADHFGAPQDIEWAMDDAGLHILQARPITTPLHPLPVVDDNLTIFDNSNIIESYPGLVSPLTYSFAVHVYSRVYRAFISLLGVSGHTISENSTLFDNLLGRIDGRVYYNLLNWYRALALLPGFALNRAYMETMMGVSQPLPAEVAANIGPPAPKGLGRIMTYARLSWVGLKLLGSALTLPWLRRSFYRRLEQILGAAPDLDQANLTELAAEYRRIESQLLDKWDAPLVNDFLCMIAFGASRNLLEKWLGEQGLALHNDVMIGQGDIISAEPAQRIQEMGTIARNADLDLSIDGLTKIQDHPALYLRFIGYLDKFSDRCAQELKLESITLDKDPSSLVTAIAAIAAGPAASVKAERPQPNWTQLFHRRPVRRILARALVGWAKARVRDRENLRFERTRVFGHARRVFLRMGQEFAARGLIAEARHIFALTKDEILGAIEGSALSADLKSIIETRSAEDAASALRADPNERISVTGPAIAPIQFAMAPADKPAGTERIGTGCSAGTKRARARVIHDPKTQSLQAGEILVARHTDPGWIAVFTHASALVVERGSLLSHSAIVARELGIPCVVGLKGATQWIRDGEEIEVDGATGKVRRLNEPE